MGWDGGIGWRREGGVEGVKTRAIVGQYRTVILSVHTITACLLHVIIYQQKYIELN